MAHSLTILRLSFAYLSTNQYYRDTTKWHTRSLSLGCPTPPCPPHRLPVHGLSMDNASQRLPVHAKVGWPNKQTISCQTPQWCKSHFPSYVLLLLRSISRLRPLLLSCQPPKLQYVRASVSVCVCLFVSLFDCVFW